MKSRREKFVELAEKRVTRTIKSLRLIGNLGNRSNYSFTDEDVKKIMNVLENELKNVRRRFESTEKNEDISFKL